MVRTSRTFTLNCLSTAWAISILLASLATTKVYAPSRSSRSWLFSVTRGRTITSLMLRIHHLLRRLRLGRGGGGLHAVQGGLLDHELARHHHVVGARLGEGHHLHPGEVAGRQVHVLAGAVGQDQHALEARGADLPQQLREGARLRRLGG